MNFERITQWSNEVLESHPGIDAQQSSGLLQEELAAHDTGETEAYDHDRQACIKRVEAARKSCSGLLDSLLDPNFQHPAFSEVDEVDMETSLIVFREITLGGKRVINIQRNFQMSFDGKHRKDNTYSIGVSDLETGDEVRLNAMGSFIPPVDSPRGAYAWEEDVDTLSYLCAEFGITTA